MEDGFVEVEHEKHGTVRVHPEVFELLEKDKREQCPQRTPEWLAKRKNHLTASQIASVCGDNPYDSRLSLLRKKIGFDKPFEGNAATAHGTKFEPVAIELYEKKTGNKVFELGLLKSRNEDEDFLAGSPDGITHNYRLIEVKCPFRRKPNGKIPRYYIHQMQMLMNILRVPVCDYIEYVPEGTWRGEHFSIVTLHRDENWWKERIPILRRFWDEVTELRHAIDNNIEVVIPEEPKKRTYTKTKRKRDDEEEQTREMHILIIPDDPKPKTETVPILDPNEEYMPKSLVEAMHEYEESLKK